MSFSVVTNLSSISAQSALKNTQAGMEKTLERLSSGKRVNSSADDAAGLAQANRHQLDRTSLSSGAENAGEAIGQLQIQDGARNKCYGRPGTGHQCGKHHEPGWRCGSNLESSNRNGHARRSPG